MDNTLRTTITADTPDFLAAINAATRSVGNATDNWVNRISGCTEQPDDSIHRDQHLEGGNQEVAKASDINCSCVYTTLFVSEYNFVPA